jgi:hypothetical protein
VYHTGLASHGVTMSEDDKLELEMDRLKMIEEEGI